jgi:hypothetical protein
LDLGPVRQYRAMSGNMDMTDNDTLAFGYTVYNGNCAAEL